MAYPSRGRKIVTLLLAACLLAGCGKNGQGNPGGFLASGQPGSEADEPQGQYKAEPLEAESDTATWSRIKLAGEYVYYCLYSDDAETGNRTCRMYRYVLSDGSTEQLPVVLQNGSVGFYDVGEGGDVYAVVYYNEQSQEMEGEDRQEKEGGVRLEKYDAKGNRVYSTDIEDLPEDNRYFRMAADGEGRVYFYYSGQIACFDGQGNPAGSITSLGGPESLLTAMCRGGDGAVYACVTRNAATSQLMKLNFAERTTDIVAENFVSCAEGGLCAGWEENTLLLHDGGMVYEYDLTDRSRKALLRWTDSGLNASQIRSMGAAPEGKILVWKIGNTVKDAGVFLLRRLSEEEAPQKEEIVLATDKLQWGSGRDVTTDTLLIEAVMAFNNTSDKYHITVKEYIQNKEPLNDALTKLNLDIVSGNGPDIIYGSMLYQATSLAKQGALEDLGPWLEQSTVIGREDFMDHTLDDCIYDGKLMVLPEAFQLSTVIGRASNVGGDMGWTMEEVIAMQEKHPEAQLFNDVMVSKYSTLGKCLKLYMDNFVDWDTKKCSFDSPEFVRLLEFINRYGDTEGDSNSMYTGVNLSQGKALLVESYLSIFTEKQFYDLMLEGDACTVGYPTKDGEPASFIQSDKRCSIAAASEHKEGAWAFLESFVTYPVNDLSMNYILVPAVRMRFEEYVEKRLAQEEREFLRYNDKTGEAEPMLDEEGNPIKGLSYVTLGDPNDQRFMVIHAPTQEDVDWFMNVLRVARVKPKEQEEIEKILTEEADYFFIGDKSAQEVADIIQNRVQLYLNEQ